MLEASVADAVSSSGESMLNAISSAFADELKYYLLIGVAMFSSARDTVYCILSAFKGITAGICCACVMRAIRSGAFAHANALLGCPLLIVLSVAGILLLCLCCSVSHGFSKRTVYPPRLRFLLKRKDTYSYLLSFFAICGAALIIILLKYGNLHLLISPKGM